MFKKRKKRWSHKKKYDVEDNIMNTSPIISVIMPSLNVEDYMRQCLKSVLNQSLTDIEVICIDAGSTDKTVDIIKECQKDDDRIKFLTSDKKSYGYQVNMGLKEAKGKYISIIETDDYISSNMFETLYSLSEDDTIDIIKSNFFYLNDYDENDVQIKIDVAKRNLVNDGVFTLKEEPLIVEGHPSIWAGIYRRDFLIDNNIKFLEVPKGGWVDNPFFYETAIKAEKIRYINDAFYYYRITNPNSSTNDFGDNKLPMQRILDIYDVFERCGEDDLNVVLMFYIRIFRYVEIILENTDGGLDSLDYDTCAIIQKVLSKVDESLVKEYMNKNFKALYYKFMSPLVLLKFNT